MFKLIKYELRRNLTTMIILLAVIAGLEAFSLYAMYSKSETQTAISFSLLMFGGFTAFMVVFILAVKSYSSELGSKYSYMTFMTPTSTYSIIGSKLLTTGIVALVTTVLSVLLVVIDYNVFLSQFDASGEMESGFKLFLSAGGTSLSDIYIGALAYFIVLWIGIFTWICLAYLAITLSATAFANKKFRGFMSFCAFVLLAVIINVITDKLPTVDIGSGSLHVLLTPLYSYIVDIVAIIGAFLASGLLLDKKVSL